MAAGTLGIMASGVAAQGVAASGAFTAAELNAYPTTQWITNGGNLANQRYSPLDQINRDTVAGLKAEWRASLDGSGVTPRGSNQAEPMYYDGSLYIITSENDVFAIDVETGNIQWKYDANVDAKVARPCCGWAVRGIAMGEGRIFVGRLDADVVALDQKTGREIWRVQEADPLKSYSITSAPRYYDGLVITGTSGGVLGTRGRVTAYDAATGELVWRFYTIPGPGEFGHDTWPADSEVWQYGGAAVWQTPAVDPELGLIYFSTSNPGPVLNGAVREGDNLFSASIVAIDAKTGEYRWHFQEVHHDLWDYDASNPVILFDVEIDGRMRKGLAQAGKTGWVYILDRETGEPLIGIEERPVMQEPQQKTSPTQPFPIGDAIVPQSIDIRPEGYELINEGRIFTPYTDTPTMWKPLAAINWPPSSYDPNQHLMYICASDAFWGATGGDPDFDITPAGTYSGGVVYPGGGPRRGIFAALDVTTNRIAWRQQWGDQCYSGSMTTGGGLTFVGRNDGRLMALNSTTGRKVWEFQTDGGVNAPAITFLHEGRQYVAAYAGGTLLAPSKRSDGLWLFSLHGDMDSLPRGAASMTGQTGGAERRGPPGPPPDREADLGKGQALYTAICATCHGDQAEGGTHGGPALTDALTLESVMYVVSRGQGDMPAFGTTMSEADLHDVSSYVTEKLLSQ